MKSESKRVLIVDDDEQDRSYLSTKIHAWGYVTETACDGVEALERIAHFEPDVVISDVRMPRMDGFDLVRRLQSEWNAPPVIMLTQFGGIDTAIAAMHDAGVFWFIEKPTPMEVLRVLLQRANEQRDLRAENERLRRVLRSEGTGNMVGGSADMQDVFSQIRRVAPSRATVLITGESGTGKDLVAQAIHASSPRREAPFIALNCAALPETLIESELFGHEKGAFTGAVERRLGKLELADGGTLFLDEIGELPLSMQAKLLRVLEDSMVRRLGGRAETRVDVRILAATNRVPEVAVREGKMREDLYYRLNVFNIHLTPLRERMEDVPPLVQALLGRLVDNPNKNTPKVDPTAMEQLQRYHWPGNIRELRNVLERALILSDGKTIQREHLPEGLGGDSASALRFRTRVSKGKLTVDLGQSMQDLERAIILATMAHVDNDRRRTAEILGLSLKTIHMKLKQYRLDRSERSEVSVMGVRV